MTATEVDIGGREVAETFMVAAVIVVADELIDLGFKITGQIVVLDKMTECAAASLFGSESEDGPTRKGSLRAYLVRLLGMSCRDRRSLSAVSQHRWNGPRDVQF